MDDIVVRQHQVKHGEGDTYIYIYIYIYTYIYTYIYNIYIQLHKTTCALGIKILGALGIKEIKMM